MKSIAYVVVLAGSFCKRILLPAGMVEFSITFASSYRWRGGPALGESLGLASAPYSQMCLEVRLIGLCRVPLT